MSKNLPARPSLEHLKKQAKDLLDALSKADPSAIETVARYFPSQHDVGLNDAQLVIAREYGFDSWTKLKDHVEAIHRTNVEDQFFDALQDERLEDAQQLWREHKEAIRKDLKSALRAGDRQAVQEAIAADPSLVNEKIAPHDQPALSYISFSPLLKVAEFERGLLDTARFLLDRGADPNGGAQREWGTETVLFGASAIRNNPALTQMLVDAGASPNDGESIYHSCEHSPDNRCLRILLNANPSEHELNWCFRRKLDYEDEEGIRLFLDHGADPNVANTRTALSYAVTRRRSLAILRLLVERGADVNAKDQDGTTPYAMARRLGNREAAEFLLALGADPALSPEDAILAAAVDGDEAKVRELAAANPEAVKVLTDPAPQVNPGFPAESPLTVTEMAQLGHVAAVRALLDIGMSPDKVNEWNETPLHWACVAGRPEVVRLLLERGASTEIRDKNHNSDALGWALWASENWIQEHGDYAETVRAMLEGGAKKPETVWVGTPEVRAVLGE